MRFPVVFPSLVCLGMSATLAWADSAPVAEPVEETPSPAAVPAAAKPAAPEAKPAEEPSKPVVAPVNYAEPAPAEPAAPARREAAPAAERPRGEWTRVAAAPEKITRQTHSGYYVNRVKFQIPAGVKIDVKKDWYAKDITLEYPANPYSNWQGVTPEAFAFKHTGTTLEVRHVTPKYLPATVIVRVPSAVEVSA